MKLLEYIKKTIIDPKEIKDVCNSVIQRMMELDSVADTYEYNYKWQERYEEWDSVTEVASEILDAFNDNVSIEEIEDMYDELVEMIEDFQCIYGTLSRWNV